MSPAPVIAAIRRLRFHLVLAAASLVALGCAELALPDEGAPQGPAQTERPRHARRAERAAEREAAAQADAQPEPEVAPPPPPADDAPAAPAAAPPPPSRAAASATPGCLVADPHFQRGVEVNDPQEGVGHRVIGRLAGLDPSADTGNWDLSQWNTRTPYRGQVAASGGDAHSRVYRSGSKEVVFGAQDGDDSDVELRLDSAAEFDGKPRPQGVRWPALYLWQKFKPTIPLSAMSAVNFSIDYRLSHIEGIRSAKPRDPGADAAQFTVFMTVQNMNKASPDFGHYVWFGLPLFDSRFSLSPQHEQADQFTKKFIYLVDASKFADVPAASGRWVHAKADVLGEMKASFQIARGKGYFGGKTTLDDMFVTAINVGWEIPGAFDAAMQVKNLSLCVD